jgi:hypothetical protein
MVSLCLSACHIGRLRFRGNSSVSKLDSDGATATDCFVFVRQSQTLCIGDCPPVFGGQAHLPLFTACLGHPLFNDSKRVGNRTRGTQNRGILGAIRWSIEGVRKFGEVLPLSCDPPCRQGEPTLFGSPRTGWGTYRRMGEGRGEEDSRLIVCSSLPSAARCAARLRRRCRSSAG